MSSRNTFRALFLSTLLVTATLAGTVALTGTVAAAASGLTGGSVTPDSVEERVTEDYDVAFTITDVDTNNSTTAATANVSFASEFDLSGASVSGESVSGNVSNVSAAVDGDVVSVTWDDGGGVDAENLTVGFTVEDVDTSGPNDAAALSADVDADADGTFEVNGEQIDTVDVEAASVHTSADEYDDVVDSGTTRWVGQELFLKAPGDDNATYRLMSVEDDGDLGSLVTQVPLDENAEGVLSTAATGDDDGFEYVVVDENNDPVVFDDSGVATGTDTVAQAKFSLNDQTFSAAFDRADVSNTGEETTSDLEIDSNRANYRVELSADGLDQEDLQSIFAAELSGDDDGVADDADDGLGGTAVGTFEDDGTDYVRLQVPRTSNPTLSADFTDVDPGTYNFTVGVADTDDEAEASIEVAERDADRDIEQSIVRDHAGDEVEFTVQTQSTDEAVVLIGGPGVNMLERVELRDDDDDGRITFEMNTFLAGRNPADVDGMDDISDAYTSEDDDVVDVTRPRSDDDGPTTTTDNVGGAGDLDIDANLSDPMAPGAYDLYVTSNTRVEANQDDELVVPDEQDVAVLDLEPGQFRSVTPLVMPRNANADERDEVLEAATESTTVADGDQLVLSVDAAGIGGYVDDDAGDFQNNHGLYLAVREADASANRDPRVLDLTSNAVELVPDEANDTYYVVVDTGRWVDARDGNDLENQRYTAELVSTGDETDVYDELDDWYGSGTYSSSPYLDDAEARSVESSFTVEERDAGFPDAENGRLSLVQYEESRVTAETNLAPGSEVMIRLQNENRLFTENAEVLENGTANVTFDTSGLDVGTTLTASVRLSGERLASVDAEVVERTTPTETPFETTFETETPSETTTTETTESTTTSASPGGNGPGGSGPTDTTSDDGPGFGAAVAVLALLAAALLAVRRDA